MKEEAYIRLSQTKEGDELKVVTDLKQVDTADVVMFFLRTFKQSEPVREACFLAMDVFRGFRACMEVGVENLFTGVDDENDDEE